SLSLRKEPGCVSRIECFANLLTHITDMIAIKRVALEAWLRSPSGLGLVPVFVLVPQAPRHAGWMMTIGCSSPLG
ncbi:MAG TPA: hypothetical protein DEF45_07180, partial [Rhodopirellula sp.]|nr:hypothetical protein [Rhodopirellula sp.]